MEYLFITGRNRDLSTVEVLSYLEKEKIQVRSSSINSNGFLVDLDSDLDLEKTIKDLGGVIGIGKVLFKGDFKKIMESIQKEDLYFSKRNKLIYSFISFLKEGKSPSIFLDEIKGKFRREKIKARYNGLGGEVKTQEGENLRGSPSKLKSIDTLYFVLEDKEYHFGVISAICDPKEVEKRDMKKPIRREKLSISPRLSKILINLSQVKENETLLDPFCGVGSILQESLIKNINVIGIDSNQEAINGAKINLDWLNKNYNIKSQFELINSDSKVVKLKEVDGISTEPELGKLLTKIPKEGEARVIIQNFEKLLINVLNNLRKYLKKSGKIAFTTPFIKTDKGRISCDINKICNKTGLKLYQLRDTNITFPVSEVREGQIVGRNFYVLVNSP